MGRWPQLSASFIHTKEVMMIQIWRHKLNQKYRNTQLQKWFRLAATSSKKPLLIWPFPFEKNNYSWCLKHVFAIYVQKPLYSRILRHGKTGTANCILLRQLKILTTWLSIQFVWIRTLLSGLSLGGAGFRVKSKSKKNKGLKLWRYCHPRAISLLMASLPQALFELL